MEFSGLALPMSGQGVEAAADLLGVDGARIWAVLRVETKGCGFLADRRPQILFERHRFHKETGGAFDKTAPDISSRRSGGYGASGPTQYERLARAIALNRWAALRSTSWGIGQVMGFHAETVKYSGVEAMVSAMTAGEDEQLRVMATFIAEAHLGRPLQREDWASFARGYNGADFARNHYDERLRHEYADLVANGLPDLQLRAVQMRLMFSGFDPGPIDGQLGNLTRDSLRRFQGKAGLPVTGTPDDATVQRLETIST